MLSGERSLTWQYKRNEFFDKYYTDIFEGLNAAQMVMAVLIFRYCDTMRKRVSKDRRVQAHRPFSQHYLAYIVGKRLLQESGLKLKELTHTDFKRVRQYFEDQKEKLYEEAEAVLGETLVKYFNEEALEQIDGRTMAAAFRRFDLIERYLKYI